MKHLPLFFDLTGRRVAVVGEGPKADLRVQLARSAGADVLRLEAGFATVQLDLDEAEVAGRWAHNGDTRLLGVALVLLRLGEAR